MEKAELIEAIKTNVRAIQDTLSRIAETTVSKTRELGDAVPVEDLIQMKLVLDEFSQASEQLEIGAQRLGQLGEKVA